MYKILNGNSPEYLKRIVTVNETGAYNLRNQRSVNVPHTRLETFYKSFVPLTCRLWNTLTTSVKNAPSINTFKQLLTPKFEQKKLYFYGERWPAVHHARMRMGCSKLKGKWNDDKLWFGQQVAWHLCFRKWLWVYPLTARNTAEKRGLKQLIWTSFSKNPLFW